MIKMEIEYYKKYSSDRYKNTETNYLTILTPFQKEYVKKANHHAAALLRSNPLIDSIINNTVRIRRYDILSRYQDHNNSPSVRSMHSCNIVFIYNGNAYLYSIYEDELLWIGGDIACRQQARNKVFIVGLNDVLNLSRFYSEFCLYISNLDAGHVLYNIKHVLGHLSVDYYQYSHINGKPIMDKLSLDRSSYYISFMLELDAPVVLDDEQMPADAGISFDVRLQKKFDELAPTTYVKPLLKEYANESISEKKYMDHKEIEFLPLSEKVRRNSAHTMVGNFNLDESFIHFQIEDAMKLLKQSEKILSSPFVEYCFLARENENVLRLYSITGETSIIEGDFSTLMFDDHRFFDLKTYKVVFICYSKTASIYETGLRNLLITCGEIMQITALYASSAGYSFRPMKNHNDHYIKRILSLHDEYEVNYIGVLCNSPVTQISFDI